MTLRRKAALGIWMTAAILAVTLSLTTQRVLTGSFAAMEEHDARQNMARGFDALLAQASSLCLKLSDWAAWDDTYKFIEDRNEAYTTANLIADTYATMQVDLMVYLKSDGTVVHACWRDRDRGVLDPLDSATLQLLTRGSLTHHEGVESAVFGVLNTERGPALVASRPITTSDKTGAIRGTLIMARLIDEKLIATVGKTSHLSLTLVPSEGPLDVERAAMEVSDVSLERPWWQEDGRILVTTDDANDTLGSSMHLADVFGRPAMLLSVETPRLIHAESHRASALVISGIAAACVMLSIVTVLGMRRLIIDRLSDLRDDVNAISVSGAGKQQIRVSGNDELGQLAEEIGSMVWALRLAESEAREAAESRSRFLANTSHEVRTPLNGIVCALELLSRSELAGSQAKYVRIARVASEHLMMLINDILDLSKIEAGKLELDTIEFDLPATLTELGAMFAPKAEEQRISLTCEVTPRMPRMVLGDPAKLRQVLSNLISNAVKFTSEGGVAIRAVVDRDDGKTIQLCVSVSDTGQGIPPERAGKLFQAFSQLDSSTTRRHGGTGLGLAICKRLVEMMGGQIGVASEVGRGATFWFTIPLERAASLGDPPASSLLDLRSARIWVASDSPESARVAAAVHDLGLNQIVDDELGPPKCDILVTHLPDIGATMETIGKLPIRGNGRPAIVAVLPEGCDGSEHQATLRSAGVDACIQLPLDEAQLADALAFACGSVHRTGIEDTASRDRTSAPMTRLRVLVAEDNEINRLVMRDLLSDEQCDCVMASNGRIATETARDDRFDLILMDCQMPEMDGYQAARAIRAMETPEKGRSSSGGRVPIFALTANTAPEDRAKCLSVGMDGVLSKPIDIKALTALLDSMRVRVPTAPASTAARSEPSDTPVFSVRAVDLNDLSQRCRGKRGLMRSILERFAGGLPAQLTEMEGAVGAADCVRVGALAHGLKGAASSVGCKDLAAAAAKLEVAGRAGDPDAARSAMELVRAQGKRLADELTAVLDELAAAKAA